MNNLDVIVLCGGKGQRLRPITESVPKPMVEIKGKPILSYIITYLENHGIHNVYIGTGYKNYVVDDYITSLKTKVNVQTVFSGDVDIIQRIKDAGKLIKGDFLVLYGDTISDVNIKDLILFHQNKKFMATMTVWPMRSQFGIVDFDDCGKVTSFLEKPILDKYMNIGYFYFDQKILEIMKKYDSWEVFLNKMVEMEILSAFKHNGVHITVNTVEELLTAEKNIENILSKGYYG
jgi:glucose-1-phosphate cytidylyltransferase